MSDQNPIDGSSCPHCGNADAERLPSRGDYTEYRCRACGSYRISATQQGRFEDGFDDPTKGRFTVDGNGGRWLVP